MSWATGPRLWSGPVVPGVEDVVEPAWPVPILDRLLPAQRIAHGIRLLEAAVGQQVGCSGAGLEQFCLPHLNLTGGGLVTDGDADSAGQDQAGPGRLSLLLPHLAAASRAACSQRAVGSLTSSTVSS